jgi:hypothetical protein
MIRELKHPIALFVPAVLVAIAAGVGVTAAITTSEVYGPPGARFTVAFPGRVGEQHLNLLHDTGIDYYSGAHCLSGSANESSLEDAVDAQYVSTGTSFEGLRDLTVSVRGAFSSCANGVF